MPEAKPTTNPLLILGASSKGNCPSTTCVGISPTSEALVRPLIAIDVLSQSLRTETVEVGPSSYINSWCHDRPVIRSAVIAYLARLCQLSYQAVVSSD